LTKRLPEEPAQMCLIGKADALGYFAQRCRAADQQLTRPFQPHPHHVSVRRFSEDLLEGPREMGCATLRYGANVLDVDGAVQILVDESAHARYLPGR
jgi:hypothetical protein